MPRLLYLGLDPSRCEYEGEIVHYPIIQTISIEPFPKEVPLYWPQVTHLVFTSPRGVHHWLEKRGIEEKEVLAIGSGTEALLRKHGCVPTLAPNPTQEGMWALIQTIKNPFLLWPRSSQARPFLEQTLRKAKVRFFSFDLYKTVPHFSGPRPNLDEIDAICFTSPSTVKAFLAMWGPIPQSKKIIPIGPITKRYIEEDSSFLLNSDALLTENGFIGGSHDEN